MHSAAATFYGAYDQVEVSRLSRSSISLVVIALGVAAVVLLVFIAVDVAAVEAIPAHVDVTSVEWVAGGATLATTGGFTLAGSQTTVLTLSCQGVCYTFSAASASAPFHALALSVVYHPVEYANVTLQAPGSSYTGPLTITLTLG
jgi:hypothetical protein